ncbi:hypothetical protein EDB19DRAFT_1709168 [Suillus lakei]|nr:hypothetical protein EDB19DRAFT_1709168 [Suillus lakei]
MSIAMSTADTAYRLILTAISLIAFMASTILSYTVEYQWKRSTSPWNSIRTKSLTVSKGTQDKFNHGVIYERRIFYYSSRWHVYQKGLYTGLLTVFPASESSCVGNLYVLKGLKFSRGIFGVLGLVCSSHCVLWRIITLCFHVWLPSYPGALIILKMCRARAKPP